ncbi:hypothetical protein CLOM621_08909 [Clostridium sp. M62/1]|nr:hypothetical protein CLOM621_08909 [Clostridium sp. M62/1]
MIVDSVDESKTEHIFCATCWVYNNKSNYVNKRRRLREIIRDTERGRAEIDPAGEEKREAAQREKPEKCRAEGRQRMDLGKNRIKNERNASKL